MKKTLYSLPALREVLLAANRRYLEFISAIEDPRVGLDQLHQLTRNLRQQDRTYPGFSFLQKEDVHLMLTLARGEYNLHGFQNKHLRQHLPDKNSGQISPLLKRLRLHGLVKKVSRNYKYYLTRFGKHTVTTGLKRRELVIIRRTLSYFS